jgi:hypothetical protein
MKIHKEPSTSGHVFVVSEWLPKQNHETSLSAPSLVNDTEETQRNTENADTTIIGEMP